MSPEFARNSLIRVFPELAWEVRGSVSWLRLTERHGQTVETHAAAQQGESELQRQPMNETCGG